jgi:exopolysaccharide biosynthesis polyprenyl glycosylphosphotransferase
MLKQRARAVAAGLRLADLSLLAIALPPAYWIRDGLAGQTLPGLYPLSFYWPVLATSLLMWLAFAPLTQLYQAYRTQSLSTELARLARTTVLVGLGVAASLFAFKQQDYARSLLFLYFALSFTILAATRVGLRMSARAARRRGRNIRTYAVVGAGRLAGDVIEGIAVHREWGYTFEGYIVPDGADAPRDGKSLGHLSEMDRILDEHPLDLVIFAAQRERLEDIEQAVLTCEERGVAVKICLKLFSARIAKTSVEELEGVPMLSFTSTPHDYLALFLKRSFDIVVSAVVLLAFLPVLLLVSIAIKLDSPGPIFFPQRRIGLNGREFTLYKFRSMCLDAEHRLPDIVEYNEMGGPVFKMLRDPRVTRVGRWLRRTSLDEFPQFWNVLRGEMSIVGPRPPIRSEVARYERWQRRRLSVRPGITCTWQVSGRNDIDFEQWMALDLEYIDTWSFWRDLHIVMRTIPAVILGKGAR